MPTHLRCGTPGGLSTASFFWPETKNDPSIDFNVPEVFTPESKGDITAVPKAVLDELRGAGVPIDDYFRYYGDSFLMGTSDAVLAQSAAHAISTRKPSLLAIHFLLTDEVQHELGPAHYRTKAALTAADHALGMLVDAVRAAGIADQTTFVVTADHGFATIDKQVNLAPVVRRAGTERRREAPPAGLVAIRRTDAGVRRVAAPGGARTRLPAGAGARRALLGSCGRAEFHALGIPTYDESPYIAGQDMIVGEVDTHLGADGDNPSTARVPLTPPRHEHGYLPSESEDVHVARAVGPRGEEGRDHRPRPQPRRRADDRAAAGHRDEGR